MLTLSMFRFLHKKFVDLNTYLFLTREELELPVAPRDIIVRSQEQSISAFETEVPLEFEGLAGPVEPQERR